MRTQICSREIDRVWLTMSPRSHAKGSDHTLYQVNYQIELVNMLFFLLVVVLGLLHVPKPFCMWSLDASFLLYLYLTALTGLSFHPFCLGILSSSFYILVFLNPSVLVSSCAWIRLVVLWCPHLTAILFVINQFINTIIVC